MASGPLAAFIQQRIRHIYRWHGLRSRQRLPSWVSVLPHLSSRVILPRVEVVDHVRDKHNGFALIQARLLIDELGRIRSGPLTADFSYLDTRAEFGLITELICMRFLGIHTRVPPPLALYMGRRQMKSGKRALSL